MRSPWFPCMALLAVLFSAQPAEADGVRLGGVRSILLPAEIEYGFDVRWKSEQTVLLAAGRNGVVEVDLQSPGTPRIEIQGGGVPKVGDGPIDSFFFSSHLGHSAGNTLVGSGFLAVAWKAKGRQANDVSFANLIDLDLSGEQGVILGVRGTSTGHWGSIGPTLWRVRFSGTKTYFDPMEGPDGERMRACHILQVGAVRVTADGRAIVAPGVEPGVRLFDRQGKLVRTWKTAGLGYEDRCSLTFEQSEPLAHMGPRQSWMNRRQLLDEMIVLPEGPMLIIRQPVLNGTRWRGVLLPYSGKPVDVAIPVSSKSPHAHVRADVRGSRVIASVFEMTGPGEKPIERPRLVLMNVER